LKLLIVSLVAIAVTAWTFTLRPTFLGGPAGYIIVSGHSMEPTFFTGDLVITHTQHDYKTGEIVTFHVEGGNVIHRITGGDGATGFDTQGDNNSFVDEWHPQTKDVVGKEWLHISGAGKRLQDLRQPPMFATLMAGMATFSLVSFKEVKRRRRGGKGMLHPVQTGGGGQGRGPLAAPSWALFGLTLAAVALVGFGFLAFNALRTRDTKSTSVTLASYKQSVAYDYTAKTDPSTLYPAGIVGPVVAPPDGAANGQVTPPPIYTKGAKSLDLDLTYSLQTDEAAQVQGQISADLLVKADGEAGWTMRQPLLAPTPFDGTQTRVQMTVDFAPLESLIDTVEKETGFIPSSYEFVVQPVISLSGAVAGQPVNDQFSPPFTIKYSKTAMTGDPTLIATQPKTVSGTLLETQRFSLLGSKLPLPRARLLFSTLTLLAVAAVAVFSSVVFLGWGLDETARVRARYGTKLVPVTEVKQAKTNRVQVARLEDLAVLAQRDGKIIFSQTIADTDVFFVPDGPVTYEYTRQRVSKGA
jgi:signal peptidase I